MSMGLLGYACDVIYKVSSLIVFKNVFVESSNPVRGGGGGGGKAKIDTFLRYNRHCYTCMFFMIQIIAEEI